MSLILSAALLFAAPQDPVEIGFDRLFVVEATAPGRRSPVVVDAIEAQVVRGTFADPSAGLMVERAEGGPLTWRPLVAGEDGWFEDAALRGGWGFATLELDEPAIMILDASGHRRVYVNGVPRMGDVYGLGITKLPVALEAGTNRFLFRGGRGRLRAKLTEAPDGPYFVGHDSVVPDLIDGSFLAGLRVANPSDEWVSVESKCLIPDWETQAHNVLPPLSVTQLPFWGLVEGIEPVDGVVIVNLVLNGMDRPELDRTALDMQVKDLHEKHKRTFQSTIDGSVQYYAITPPPPLAEDRVDPLALVLSLHGASVEATNQAYSYAQKDWAVIVAPTNRRPFGFDWEDWGRYDALEVFELAKREWLTDPRRQYLTGHSMGGHGTWNLGAHLAGTFAAIAPSAGWRDFWAYGTDDLEEPDPIEQLLADAANPSRTLLMKENYLHGGVYVLHGDADDNVGVEQARYMRGVLSEYHPNFAYYERPGAGHWWGNECLDWPPLFDFLKNNVSPEPEKVRSVVFTTVNPAIHASTHWVTIHSQERSLEPSHVEIALDSDERRITASTENVARLTLDLATGLDGDQPLAVVIDEVQLAVEWSEDALLHLARVSGDWIVASAPDPAHKSPARAGPFKDAFRGRMVFAYGTQGDDERDDVLFQQARMASEVFAYRGNGSVPLVPDTSLDPRYRSWHGAYSHVVLFGNSDDNALWKELLGDSPVQVADGFVRVGERTIEGDDLIALFLRPDPSHESAAVAAIAGSGDVGARLATVLPYFVSGVGYPDWTVIGADMLERGAEGIRAAGFFGPDWGLESGRAAWR